MTDVRQGDELQVFAGKLFSFSVAFTELVRNVNIGSAMNKDLRGRDVLFGGRGFTVAIGSFCWRAAQKSGNSIIAQVQLPCATQVKHAGQRERASDRRFVRGKAECKLAARGVSSNAEAIAIELRKLVFRFFAVKETVCAAKIVECSRPSSTGIADAPVFDIQRCDPGLFQSMA